jgi:hypothetical protein
VAFIDRVEIGLSAGKGGDGCASFARYARDPLAGPDGGDGGNGGDVIIAVKSGLEDLERFVNIRHLSADNGRPGEGRKCYGKDGDNLIVEVPCGTRIVCLRSGEELASLTRDNDRVTLLKGGKGGRGNVKFANATRRTPKKAEKGEACEERLVEIVYRQPAPIAILESTQSVAEDYYFRLYGHLSGNCTTEFHFYLRKPRRFFWEYRFRKYPLAFIPFQLRRKQSDNVRFPNLAHLYFVHIAVVCFAGLDEADTGAVLHRMLEELEDLPHPNLEYMIIAFGGKLFGKVDPELLIEWQRMCDNHIALNGVNFEFIQLPAIEDENSFTLVTERIAELGLKYASGD